MTTKRSDPSALRFLIGHDLRVSRERAGKKQSETAAVLGCSQAKINYLEGGKTQQKPDEVTAMLRFYGAETEHVDRMTSLAGRADQGTWWAPFSDVLPNWLRTFVGLEGLASAAFSYRSLLVPGQLQTPEYATAVLEGNLRVAPMDVAQVVRARMARRRPGGDDDDSPLRFRTVIEQYVLERTIGGPDVMSEQLDWLLALMQLDTVELHVMPVDRTVHDGLDGDFLLLDFEEAQSIGYIEYSAGAIYIQDPDQLETYTLAADRLCAAALSTAESACVIAAHRDALLTRLKE